MVNIGRDKPYKQKLSWISSESFNSVKDPATKKFMNSLSRESTRKQDGSCPFGACMELSVGSLETLPSMYRPLSRELEAWELISQNPLPGGLQIRFCQWDTFSLDVENRPKPQHYSMGGCLGSSRCEIFSSSWYCYNYWFWWFRQLWLSPIISCTSRKFLTLLKLVANFTCPPPVISTFL